MVSLYKGEVAGFRGYFAARFEISEKDNNHVVLFPGDTCVHPAHRRKGLSVAMGNMAMKEYAQRYRLFFNTTCTRNSLPGYRRMGFLSLAPKRYVVMGVSPNNQRAYILDYSGKTGSEYKEILRYVTKAKHFNIISIYDFCLNDALRRALKSLGFQTHSLVRSIEKRRHGELPLLIRPVQEAYDEEDFLTEGVDVRRIENWSLKPICSDAA